MSGQVVDVNEELIKNVTIIIYESDNLKNNIYADTYTRYFKAYLQKKSYKMDIQSIGYVRKEVDLDLTDGNSMSDFIIQLELEEPK